MECKQSRGLFIRINTTIQTAEQKILVVDTAWKCIMSEQFKFNVGFQMSFANRQCLQNSLEIDKM